MRRSNHKIFTDQNIFVLLKYLLSKLRLCSQIPNKRCTAVKFHCVTRIFVSDSRHVRLFCEWLNRRSIRHCEMSRIWILLLVFFAFWGLNLFLIKSVLNNKEILLSALTLFSIGQHINDSFSLNPQTFEMSGLTLYPQSSWCKQTPVSFVERTVHGSFSRKS